MPIVLRKLYAGCGFNMTSEKELLTYHCGCHGNLVTIATRYVADASYPKQAPCQI